MTDSKDSVEVAEAKKSAEEKSSMRVKKSGRRPFFRAVRFILGALLSLIVLLFAYIVFSALHRKSSLDSLPSGFSACFHTDSLYAAVNPLLDLEAADRILSSRPEYSSFLPLLLNARKSGLRKNPFVALALSRKFDAALYTGSRGEVGWAAVLDMGFLSSGTRLFKFVFPYMEVDGLSMSSMPGHCYFTYTGDGITVYAAVLRNLVVASSSYELLEKSVKGGNRLSYSAENLEILLRKESKPFRILVDAGKIVRSFSPSSEMSAVLSEILKADSLTAISFEIKDTLLSLSASLPFSGESENPKFEKIISLLKSESSVPLSLENMGSRVQYYSVVNAGSLRGLKDAVFPVLPKEKKYESLWNTASALSKTVLKNSLDDLLFSWTGGELLAFGIEGLNDPVFAVQISDEDERRRVFDQLSSSIIVRDDTSLILDGVRLPRLLFPDFIQNLIGAFGANLPSPYYMVLDGFMYFSQSPEPLSAVFNSHRDGRRISKNPNWQSVSKNQRGETTLSVFYDLERSVPFFLKGKNDLSELLSLYSIGRFDVRLSSSNLDLSLEAGGRKTGDSRNLAGFPVALSGRADGKLLMSESRNGDCLFWLEDGKVLKSYQVSTGRFYTRKFTRPVWIKAAGSSRAQGEVWALSDDGTAYLLDPSLAPVDNFPLVLDGKPSCEPSVMEDSLVVPMVEDRLCYLSHDGKETFVDLKGSALIKSPPAVMGRTVAVYQKSFLGKIYIVDGGTVRNSDFPLEVPSIAYGSPLLYRRGKSEFVAFITQNGNLHLWENGVSAENFPIKLDGIFHTGLAYNGRHLFALSASGQLFRVDQDGSFFSVQVPSALAREGRLAVGGPDRKDSNVYVGIDGNMIYGFSEALELLSNFPLNGFGRPVFVDVNGDGFRDCVVLTLDDRLNAWNLR